MKCIKFSHKYDKLPAGKTCFLLSVCPVMLNQLPKAFIEYDTRYITNETEPFNIRHYELKERRYLLLIFWGKHAFSTIRSYNKQKEEYYRSLIGQEFEIIIKEIEK